MKFVYGKKYLLHVMVAHAILIIFYFWIISYVFIMPFLFVSFQLVILNIITIRSGVALDSRSIACLRKEDPNNGYGGAVSCNFLMAVGFVCLECFMRFG